MQIIRERRTIFITVIICMKYIASYGISKCSVPSVRKGQKTNLTCYFNEELRKSNNTVKIIRYTNTTEGLEDTTVLLCQLSSTNNPKCHTYSGYVFKGIETDKLSLEIFHAEEQHIGTYECHVFYSDSSNDKPCKLELEDYGLRGHSAESSRRKNETQGIKTNCSVPSVGKGQKTNLTCYFGTDIGNTSNTVKIIRYTNTNNSFQDTMVFLCQLSSNPLTCRTYSGYAFEGNITDKLTLIIPHADEEHVASYECHVLYSQQGSDTPCVFEFNDYVLRTTSEAKGSDMINSPGDNGHKLRMDMIIILLAVIGSLLGILLAVVVGLLAFYFKWIKPRQRQANRREPLLINT